MIRFNYSKTRKSLMTAVDFTSSQKVESSTSSESLGWRPLCRLLFMLRAGDPIVKLIWIVPSGWHAELDRIVFPWVQMWKTAFDVKFPLIEYRNANGTFLGDLGTSRSSRRSSPAPPKSPADKIKA